jgi:hypothetical protein
MKEKKDTKRRPICFFLDHDFGLNVFELKFTGRDPAAGAV